jgi:hypothetical protein
MLWASSRWAFRSWAAKSNTESTTSASAARRRHVDRVGVEALASPAPNAAAVAARDQLSEARAEHRAFRKRAEADLLRHWRA